RWEYREELWEDREEGGRWGELVAPRPPGYQRVESFLVARLRRGLQVQLVAALGVVGDLLLGEVAQVPRRLQAVLAAAGERRPRRGHHHGVERQAVVERERRRPQLAAALRPHQQPPAAAQPRARLGPDQEHPAAVEQGLHAAEQDVRAALADLAVGNQDRAPRAL